ncbi:MAG: helix-turn-helix domain-containing protein [Firmicutes bacterium]|nr:helix-turn-helix domain-containing protein [Bacillota bacterium]
MRTYKKRITLFSERIKELRLEKNVSQQELAKKLGFNRSAISEWENRGKEPSFITLCDLAQYFDVSIDYLLGYPDCIQ